MKALIDILNRHLCESQSIRLSIYPKYIHKTQKLASG